MNSSHRLTSSTLICALLLMAHAACGLPEGDSPLDDPADSGLENNLPDQSTSPVDASGDADARPDMVTPSEDMRMPDMLVPDMDASDMGSPDQNADMESMPCGANEYVEAHTCQPCPGGQTRQAGDDPAGADTSCADACAGLFGSNCDDFLVDYIKAENAGNGDKFGSEVHLLGDRALIGAPGEASDGEGPFRNTEPDSGAVYVFEPGSSGRWQQTGYLKSDAPGAERYFGGRIAQNQDFIAVSIVATIYEEQDREPGVFIYTRENGAWVLDQIIRRELDQSALQQFGSALDMSEGVLAIGARGYDVSFPPTGGRLKDYPVTEDHGAVYLYMHDGTSWVERTRIDNPVGDSKSEYGDAFGHQVALDAGRLLVSAIDEASASTGVNGDSVNDQAPGSGAAFLIDMTP